MAPTKKFLVCVLALGVLLGLPRPACAVGLDPRLEAAARLYREEGAEKALPVFESLADEFAQAARADDHAAALHYVGECFWRLGSFAEARRHLDRALELERDSGDRLAQGRTQNVRGLLSWDEGNYEPALADFRKAGELARAGGDRKLEGASLNNLSLVYDEQGDYDVSLEQYRRVLELYRGADFQRGVGDTLGNIGGVHLLLGHFRQALGYYRQALTISEQLKSGVAMSQDHGNIGLCLLGMGEIDDAIAHLDQAIELATQAGMQQDRAYWLRVRAGGLVEKGQYNLALIDYRVALAIYERVDAQAELIEALHGFGQLHLLLGDPASAERDFRRALDLAQSIGLDRGITRSFISLGDLELRRKQAEAAAAYYEQARQRAAEAGVQHALALSLLRLARVNRSLQKVADAAAQTERSLLIARQVGAPGLEAEALFSRAELALLQKRFHEALEHYEAAERKGAAIGDPDLLWQIQFGRARVHEATGDTGSAVRSLEAAITTIEGVRGRLLEPRFRSGYLEDKFQVYLELMRLQLQQGLTADAFVTAERLRARSFVEQLGGRASVPLSSSDRRVEAELRERIRRLNKAVAETDENGVQSYPQRALDRFSLELVHAEEEYATFLDDHARIRGAGSAIPSASDVQHRLSADEALLEYVVGQDNLVVFVLTRNGLAVQSVPLRSQELAARIALLRDLVRQPGDGRWYKPAARLSEQLIDPLEGPGWLDGVNHLHIVPHNALTYLPFALLPRPAAGRDALLIDRYTVTYLPAAAALLRETPVTGPAESLLAVAPSRGGLRHARTEARAVDALFQPNSRILIDADATESRFKQLAGNYRVLHLATHGRFNEASPLLSGLELEPDKDDDGMLRVHEILDLQLRAELVTLSACDTALGTGYFSRLPQGEEFVGLSRAFVAAGSASVVATLWQVDDRASVSLMERFYTRLNSSRDDRNAASALAFAQRAHRSSTQLGHPYYWAAYIVVGQTGPSVRVAGGAPRGAS